jgi:hypothetical protein
MSNEIKYGKQITDIDWGCEHSEVEYSSQAENVKLCLIEISDIQKIASALTSQVQDTSWMMELDKGTRRSYDKTVEETTQKLVEVFRKASEADEAGGIAGEFGESLVSMGSARALEMLFDHIVLPMAELWKPQAKQNEGFDFHTVCPEEIINFAEAKFSSVKSKNPHGDAIPQACRFLDEDKHHRDRVHLISLVSHKAIENLANDDIGVFAAFSINSVNPLKIFENALASAQEAFPSKNVKSVYLVGVKH